MILERYNPQGIVFYHVTVVPIERKTGVGISTSSKRVPKVFNHVGYVRASSEQGDSTSSSPYIKHVLFPGNNPANNPRNPIMGIKWGFQFECENNVCSVLTNSVILRTRPVINRNQFHIRFTLLFSL